MFWSDWGVTAKIERSTLLGESRKTIVSGGLVWPNDIAIDYKKKKLFWTEAKLDKIECSDYNGNNRLVIYQRRGIHPFGIVVLGSFLYWTDWKTGLHIMNLTNNGSVTSRTLPGPQSSLFGLARITGNLSKFIVFEFHSFMFMVLANHYFILFINLTKMFILISQKALHAI